MNSVKTLITGAGGFIGSHLAERLVCMGHRVRAFVHYNSRNDWGLLELLPEEVKKEIEVIPGDIQDPFSVRNAVKGCGRVYHLASLIAIPYSYVAPDSFVRTNVLGALHVLRACMEEKVERLIHASTSECYGTAQYVPIDEEHPLRGQSPYAASKISADMVAESHYRSFGLPVAIVRPFNTYGPRQSARAVIPTIITQALSRDVVRLGSLHPTRDFCFVDDTVEGFVKAAHEPEAVGQVLNLGRGDEIAIGELARLVMELVGREVPILVEDARKRPPGSEVDRLACDNRKASRILGWRPLVSLEEGLRKTIAWMERHLERYKVDQYTL